MTQQEIEELIDKYADETTDGEGIAEEQEVVSEIQEEIASVWDETLSSYTPFGLTYYYDKKAGLNGYGLTMYYKGQEVRGIVDTVTGTWITEHTGNSTYADDAIELYVVYENGKIAGLRPATNEEQKQWDDERNK